ncbi:MAG TPA: alpha-rhamnosidase, partial [Porphyromonadaceae bacterium]|nr:alpha-rhamnosidase [Porphyromonadaceae bacterium]HBL35169.1 alpha-rhamnosidase [Porphyromonadaceae bacterium]
MLNGLQGKSQVTVNNLRCEYLDNPLGIDEARPRFTWQLTSEKSGMSQTAYQLSVGRDQQEVAGGQGNSWKSDIVESSVIPAVYEGPELLPFTRYFWSVRVLNDEGQWSDWSQPAFFETGIMYPSGWKGSWISDGNGFDGNSIQVKQAPYFRKEFRAGKA